MNDQQTRFDSRDAFVEWRAHWRKQFKAVSKEIRHYKQTVRTANDSATVDHCRSLLKRSQMTARSLMIARQAVESDHNHHSKQP